MIEPVVLNFPCAHGMQGSTGDAEYFPLAHEEHLIPAESTTESWASVTMDPAVHSLQDVEVATLVKLAAHAAQATVEAAEK